MKILLFLPMLMCIQCFGQQEKQSRIIYPNNTFTNFSKDTPYTKGLHEEVRDKYLFQNMIDKLDTAYLQAFDLTIEIAELEDDLELQHRRTLRIQNEFTNHQMYCEELVGVHEEIAIKYKKQRKQGYYAGAAIAGVGLILAIIVN